MIARENVVLIGFMGSGKSSIGRLLAQKLGYRFADTDQIVRALTGREISRIFADEGEEAFREYETRALESFADADRHIIATGGGIVLRSSNVVLLKQLGFVVWLHASEEVIFERVSRNDRRPLLQTPDPRATVHTLLQQREPLYRAASDCSIDTSALSHEQIATAVISESRRRFSAESES